MTAPYPVTRGRHLNHVAWLYDPLVERLSFGRERKFREKTMAWMAVAPNDRILDVGCGTGSLTLLLAQRINPAAGKIIGIDAAPRMIAIARKKAAKKGVAADFQVGIAESLAFADHSFFGFVFQSFNLIPVLSAYENVEYVLLLQGVPPAERRQRVGEALARVGLDRLMHKRPGQLSGGQQQRVAAARAIVGRPLLVLADEPNANLDSQTGAELIDLFFALQQQDQTTFVFSSHDPAVIQRARRVLAMRDGRIVSDGSGSAGGQAGS